MTGSKGGRPAIGAPIQLRLPAETVAEIDAMAAAEGVTRSQWVRQAVSARLHAAQPVSTAVHARGVKGRLEVEGRNQNPTATGHFDCYGDVHWIYCGRCGYLAGKSTFNGPSHDDWLHCRYTAVVTTGKLEAPDARVMDMVVSEVIVSRSEADRAVLEEHVRWRHDDGSEWEE